MPMLDSLFLFVITWAQWAEWHFIHRQLIRGTWNPSMESEKKRNFERLSVKIVIFLNKNHLCKQTQEWKQIQSDLENGSQEWFSSLWSSTYYHTCLPLVRSSFSHTSWTIGVVFLCLSVINCPFKNADTRRRHPARTHTSRTFVWMECDARAVEWSLAE